MCVKGLNGVVNVSFFGRLHLDKENKNNLGCEANNQNQHNFYRIREKLNPILAEY